MKKLAICFFIVFFSLAPSRASNLQSQLAFVQIKIDLIQCAGLEAAQDRLKCYDTIAVNIISSHDKMKSEMTSSHLPQSTQDFNVFNSNNCEIVAERRLSKMVVCKPILKSEEFASAGRWACQGESYCNAWFWYSLSNAPKKSSSLKNEPLHGSEKAHAIAVWSSSRQSVAECKSSDCYYLK